MLLESTFPCDIEPGDEQVDIVGPFVGYDRLQVHHVAHHGKVAGDAHGTQYLPRLAGYIQGHFYIVSLGHGDLRRSGFALILKHSKPPGQQLGLGDPGEHLCQLFLGELE